MAITTSITSSSPAVFSTIPSLKTQTQSSPPIHSSKFTSASLVISNEALTIAAAANEAVALASAAVLAAREAVALVYGSGEIWFSSECGDNDLVARRKKRRKRRKGSVDCLDLEEQRHGPCVGVSFEPVVSNGCLSTIEEAEFCLCLKDQARLEAARRRIAENQEHEPTLNQLARALRIRKKNVDKILYRGRLSQERITHNYRRLVVSIAKRYRGKGLSLQDLIQEGSIGLLRGAERFDPRRGNKLSTYVYWWIKQAIITSISTKSRTVRLPRSMMDKMTKIVEAKISLSKRLGRLPSCEEIAKELNVNVSTVRVGFLSSRSPLSLDYAVSDQGGMTLQEIIPGPEELTPENMVKKQLMKQELEELVQKLTEREAHILRSIFGMNGQTPQTCDEIGRSLKLSRERIRQINSIALSKLRYKNIIDSLKMYI